MSDKLRELRGQLTERRNALAAVFKEADNGKDESGRQVYDLSKATALTGDSGARVEQVKKLNTEMEAIQEQIAALEGDQDVLSGIAGNVEGLNEIVRPAIHQGARRPIVDAEALTIGSMFVKSKAFTNYQRGNMGGGPVASFDVQPFATLFQTSAGWAPQSLRTGRVEFKPLADAPIVVNSFPELPTSQAAVKYMEETTHTNNAAEVNEGSTYGESAFALTERSVTVSKIGVWLPVTDEQLEDEAEAEAFINQRLPYQLAYRLDGQAMQGDGNAPNVLGTENVSGIQTQALGSDPIFDAALKLFTSIESDGFASPSTFFIAPSKWQTVALTRTADGLYILGNPQVEAQPKLWGVPGVKTTRCTSTKIVAGDYAAYSAMYVRRGIDMQIGYQNDDFIKGRLAIRADVRIAPVHFRPKAFGVVTGL